MRGFRFTVIFLMVLLPFCGCKREKVILPSGNSIKIGIIGPLSGADFAKGAQGLRGVQTAIAMRPLLDNGDRVELIVKDDQNDPVLAVKAMSELILTDHVAAVVTFSGSGPVLGMAKKADALQTPILAVLATHPDVTKDNGYVSQICFDNTFQGQVAAFFVRDDLLVDRVAIFRTSASYYSNNLAFVFANQYTALGGQVTDIVEIRQGETDLADTLARVRQKDPELLYMPVAAEAVIAIMQTVEQMGWNPREMASDGLLATVFSKHAAHLDLLDGLLATEFFHYRSQGTEFSERARNMHKGRADSYVAMGVEGFAILLEAMNRCEAPDDRACINRKIRSMTDFEGLMGKISIDSTGKAHRPVVINAIKDSRLEYIVKVY